MLIDVWSDVVCPWCFIGMRRLESVLDSVGGDVEVRHHPYILQPGASPDGYNLQAMLRERYGSDPKTMFGRVEAAARESGIPLDLAKQPMTYDTVGAHTLLRHAAAKGTQRALLGDLFAAYFLEARNIASAVVLAEIATRHGFTEDEASVLVSDESELAQTRREVDEAARRGIRGVPLFVFDGRRVLAGAQSVQTFRETIAQATHFA